MITSLHCLWCLVCPSFDFYFLPALRWGMTNIKEMARSRLLKWNIEHGTSRRNCRLGHTRRMANQCASRTIMRGLGMFEGFLSMPPPSSVGIFIWLTSACRSLLPRGAQHHSLDHKHTALHTISTILDDDWDNKQLMASLPSLLTILYKWWSWCKNNATRTYRA